MKSQFPEWLESFVHQQADAPEGIVAEAMDVEAEADNEDPERARVTEEEQESRMKSVDEGYNVNTDNPDDKHFESGETVSDSAFKQENKRDMTTPEGRYQKAYTSEQLKALGEAIASEILSEINDNALTPAEAMLNSQVPVSQLASVVADVETNLRGNGIRRALFLQTRERLAETLNVTLPIEISVGTPTTDDGSGPADMLGDAAPADDLGGLFDEAPVDEAPADDMETESMDDMMPMDMMANRKNRFSKKA